MLPGGGLAWSKLFKMPFEERMQAIENPDFVAELIGCIGKPKVTTAPPEQMFFMGTDEVPDYTVPNDRHLKSIADAAGEHWVETFFRISKETNGKAWFTFRMFNKNMSALEDVLQNERMFPSLGDAGAHVSQIMDAGWATFVLSHWVREKGLYSLEEAVRRMTTAPARIIGLADRGRLAPGLRADVNVLDPDRVAELQPELVRDFPGGAPRFIQRSQGYHATIVNGQLSVLDGEHQGTRAGSVLRHGA